LQIRVGTTQDVCNSSLDYEICLDLLDEVLLEAPFDPLRRQKNSVLLTVDLTKGVADEAIKRKSSVIVAYRKF
jgi:hypothetical protein